MPPVNQFKPFATGGGAFVLSQAAYEALAALSTGFGSGTAVKEQLNKVWRQSSFTAAVLQQYVAETLDSDSLDDGDLAGHVVRLRAALAAGSTNPIGASMVRGLLAFNNGAAPTTRMDITAARVHFVDVNGKILAKNIAATYVCDINVGGPTANGRDQLAAFGANNWLYFYLILNPVADTIASIVSLTPPETFDGTSLPAGYTNWAFTHSVRLDSGGALKRVVAQGNAVVYGGLEQALSNGSAIVETAVSVSGLVPPNADMVDYNLTVERVGSGSASTTHLRHLSGLNFVSIDLSSVQPTNRSMVRMPARGQNFYYLWSIAISGREMDVFVASYTVRNGG